MKKTFVILTLTAAAFILSAAPVKLTWDLNTWSGYTPLVKMTKSPDGTYSFSKPEAKYGFGLKSFQRIPAKAGDTVKFTVLAKGKGKIFLQLQNYDAKGRWLSVQSISATAPIPADWKVITMTAKVFDIKGKDPTGQIAISTGAEKGNSLQIKNAEAEIIPAASEKKVK
jgi:hypothetical protein